MDLFINTLIEWQPLEDDQSGLHVERILWIDTSKLHVITIEIFGKTSLPVLRLYEEVEKALAISEARILQQDPYSKLRRHENQISKKYRKHRDKAWKLIEGLLNNEDSNFMLDGSVRGPLIAVLAESSGRSKKMIYKYLRRYWQAGRIKNALLPAFDRCGGSGKRRLPSPEQQNPAKLGRRSTRSILTGQTLGVRITEDIERRFKRGVKKFYEKEDAKDLNDAHQKTLEEFFHEGFAIVDGKPVPVLPPADKLPSFRQFEYWYENIYSDIVRKEKARRGERWYNLQGRGLPSNSTQMAFGPGSIFQIDATPGDVTLVSSFDHASIIGRPIVYLCIDVFSRLITGISVTLEGPSWLGAMLALDSVAMNKVALCAEYGIDIVEHDWPCERLPQAILADRGEFEGYDADTLPNSLSVKVMNTAPYRADGKGIIERFFRSLNDAVIHSLPGAITKLRTRGDPDYRLKATLTLNELRKLLICYVRDYNINHYMKRYPKNEFMIADHVERYPLDIWNWGIKNRSGYLGTLPQDDVRLNLLPRKQVSVTKRGIHFERDLYYTCDLAKRERWLSKARLQGSWPIEVCYDPRSVNTIYLPLDGGTRLEPCHLTPVSKAFMGRELDEYMYYLLQENLAEDAAKTRNIHSQANFHVEQAKIIAESVEKTTTALVAVGKQSKSARTKGIGGNRAKERQIERERDAWQLGKGNNEEAIHNSDIAQVVEIQHAMQNTDEEEYISSSSKVALLRSIRDKEWSKDGE